MAQKTATILDVVEHLIDPARYVSGVLRNCRECAIEHRLDTTIARDGRQRVISNLIQVRIGTSRRSPMPNYRVERGWVIDGESSVARVYRICDGRTHKQMMEWTDAVVNERWSEGTTSMAELEILLSKVAHSK
jgi:hypothetical protein